MTRKPQFKKTQKSAKKPVTNGQWLYGKHPVLAALNNPNRKCLSLLITQNALDSLSEHQLEKKKNSHGNTILEITSSQKIADVVPADAIHQGIALRVLPLEEYDLDNICKDNSTNAPIILLDQVTDPHNIGAILRSAAAFDTAAVVITRHNAPDESAVIAKVACGALDIIPLIKVTNLAQTIDSLKEHGYWVLGLDGHADISLAEANPTGKIALVMGAEGKGLRRLSREKCDQLVKLPISNIMESLNVSNAAAISLYELRRGKH